jgi:hypothetical protein
MYNRNMVKTIGCVFRTTEGTRSCFMFSDVQNAMFSIWMTLRSDSCNMQFSWKLCHEQTLIVSKYQISPRTDVLRHRTCMQVNLRARFGGPQAVHAPLSTNRMVSSKKANWLTLNRKLLDFTTCGATRQTRTRYG